MINTYFYLPTLAKRYTDTTFVDISTETYTFEPTGVETPIAQEKKGIFLLLNATSAADQTFATAYLAQPAAEQVEATVKKLRASLRIANIWKMQVSPCVSTVLNGPETINADSIDLMSVDEIQQGIRDFYDAHTSVWQKLKRAQQPLIQHHRRCCFWYRGKSLTKSQTEDIITIDNLYAIYSKILNLNS